MTNLIFLATLITAPPTYNLTASVYGTSTDGYLVGKHTMANGRTYKPFALTAAVDPRRLREWPFGTRLRVSLRDGSKSIVVTVTDTMNRRFKNAGRERIDLSRGSWDALTRNAQPGLRQVTVQEKK